jgi:CPA2 family monovalent cation:H+ antiporter-2
VFVAASLAASRWLARPLDRVLDLLPREFFLLAVFAFLIGMAATARELGLSEAIGALMAGVVLSETHIRGEIEERFFSFRDVFAALFFFVFGLSIDVSTIDSVGWLVAAAVAVTFAGKLGGGYLAGRTSGFSQRRSFNAAVALVAHGEFTIILADLAAGNPQISSSHQAKLVAFAGLYVLVTATLGIILMKESKALGRRVFRVPRLAEEGT